VSELEAGLSPLRKLKGKLRPAGPVVGKSIKGTVYRAHKMEGMTQTNLYLAWRAPAIDTKEWVYWKLAEKAIGGDLAGRLWKLRQDEGLAYSVWMSGLSRRDQSITYISMATAGEKRERALAALRREIKQLKAGLSSEELSRVKVSYLASMNGRDRTAARRTARHASWWINDLPSNRRAALTEIIAAATLDDVNRAVAAVLSPDNLVFVEAGVVGQTPAVSAEK